MAGTNTGKTPKRIHLPVLESFRRLRALSSNLPTLAILLAADTYIRMSKGDPTENDSGEVKEGSLRTREVNLGLRDGSRIRCRLNDLGAISSIYLDNDYAFVEDRLASALTIIDIGAHIGTFTLWASKRSPKSRLVALEPNPDSFNYLTQNLSNNALDDRVLPVRGAIGGKAGHGQVLGLSTPLGTHVERVDKQESSSTKIFSLADIFELGGFDHCDVLKMDCEGAEYESILEAPDSTLESVDVLMCEYHPVQDHSVSELVSRLEGCGFRVTSQRTSVGMMWAERP